MPRLSKSQELARRTITESVAAGLSPDVLARQIMRALLTAIPCDGYRFFSVDSSTLLINKLLAASDTDGWARAEWLRDVYLRMEEIGYIELPILMQTGLSAVAFHETQETSWGYPPEILARLDPASHRRLFYETRSPIGGTLLACFASDGRWVAAMQAYRRDPQTPFRPGDVAFVRMMATVIGRGIATSFARELARAARPSEEEATGIIMLGPDNRTNFATPAAEVWCERIAEPGRAEQSVIPTAIWAAIAQLRSRGGPAAALVVPTRSGGIRVEASPAGTDGSVAVVLGAERPPVLPEAPPEWPLTSAERRVVNLALRGLTNARIAAELFISVNTVEWHLRGAYEKMGVRSRTGMLSRLFNDLAPPDLFETDRVEPELQLSARRR